MEHPAGERYLRLLVEQILASGGGAADGPSHVDNAGTALVAVGAVDLDIVEAVRDDLALGLALRRAEPDAAQLAALATRGPRGGAGDAQPVAPGSGRGGRGAGQSAGTVASPRAVATGPNRFETPDGLLAVESISFGTDGATLVETLEIGPGDAIPGSTRRGRRLATWPLPILDPMRPVVSRSPRHHRPRTDSGTGDHRLLRPAPQSTAPGAPPRNRPVGIGREQLRITDDQGNDYRRGPGESQRTLDGWRWVSALEPVPDPGTAWLEIALGDSPPSRLAVTPAGKVARGQSHGRTVGTSWLLGALQDTVARALRHDLPTSTAAVADGVDALLALGWLAPSDPLLQQLALLNSYPEGAAGLDPALGSPLAGRERRPSARTVTLPLARAVDLGERAARLDVAGIDHRGLRLSGWFSPWPAGRHSDDTSGWRLTGFDDRHNHYVATVGEYHRNPAGADVTWQLWPALDPAARSLRLQLGGPLLEASFEVVVE